VYKYGIIKYENASPGSPVRYVEGSIGKPGVILEARGPHEVNAVLVRVKGTMGYVEYKPPSPLSPSSSQTSGSASSIHIRSDISAKAGLTIL